MDLIVFENNKPLVLQGLENGEFDYMEAASEVFETEFFKYIGAKKILELAAKTYPTPRKKEEVPLWFYIASELTMRLHGVHSFHSYPMVVRTGGMVNAFFPKASEPVLHPDTEDTTLACNGFNLKNHYDRETPCDQDFLRKLAKGTDAEELTQWFNNDVARIFRSQRALDKDGIYIGDASYLFVPDNPKYEGSKRLLFDENNHPVSQKDLEKMSDVRKVKCQWKRCYKIVTLLHTNAKQEFFYLIGVKVVSGEAHECPLLYELVKEFVDAVGKDVIKKLILDRGFLDGEKIARCKKEYGINVLIPMRKNMEIYSDAMALFRRPDVKWVAYEEPQRETTMPVRLKPIAIRKREQKRQETLKARKQELPSPPADTVMVKKEAAAIGEFTSWSTCTVPLTVIANRELYADGHEEIWLLLSTERISDPTVAAKEYHLRTAIEERYRQLKCFSDLAKFTSRSLSLVTNHIIFTILAYNLLQLYLLRKRSVELTRKTPLSIRQELLPADNHIIIFKENYYALFTSLELIQLMTIGISEEARKKIGEKCQRMRRELPDLMRNPRSP
jgi:hypothetical protein